MVTRTYKLHVEAESPVKGLEIRFEMPFFYRLYFYCARHQLILRNWTRRLVSNVLISSTFLIIMCVDLISCYMQKKSVWSCNKSIGWYLSRFGCSKANDWHLRGRGRICKVVCLSLISETNLSRIWRRRAKETWINVRLHHINWPTDALFTPVWVNAHLFEGFLRISPRLF